MISPSVGKAARWAAPRGCGARLLLERVGSGRNQARGPGRIGTGRLPPQQRNAGDARGGGGGRWPHTGEPGATVGTRRGAGIPIGRTPEMRLLNAPRMHPITITYLYES
ncbi:MAG: hypothetical protein AMXMBFR53_33170 [Gemmatimonadota bacterium]